MKRRVMSLLMALAMCLTLMPSAAFAAEEDLMDEEIDLIQSENAEITEDSVLGKNESEDVEVALPDDGDVLTVEASYDPYNRLTPISINPTQADINATSSTAYIAEEGYGGQLTSEQRQVYDKLVSTFIDSNGRSVSSAVLNQCIAFTPKSGTFVKDSTDDFFFIVFRAYHAFIYDYPTAFWAGKIHVGVSYQENGSKYQLTQANLEIDECYSGAKAAVSKYNSNLKSTISSIYQSINQTYGSNAGLDDYYRALHDWECRTLSYNDEALENSSGDYSYAYSSGPVFTGNPRVVCEGYGETYKVLCDQMRIMYGKPLYCAQISGYTEKKGSHRWNYVLLPNGSWYAVDTTWDDQEGSAMSTYCLCGSATQGFDDTFANEHIEDNVFSALSNNRQIQFIYPVIAKNGYGENGNNAPLPQQYKNIWICYPYTHCPEDSQSGYGKYGGKGYNGLTFDDSWFMRDSRVYHQDLAVMSLGLVMSTFEKEESGSYAKSMGSENVESLYERIGFPKDRIKCIGFKKPDRSSVPLAMASKEVDFGGAKPATILAISLRGAGYGNSGWAGDFEVGSGATTGVYHSGFYRAAEYALQQVRTYINDNSIDTSTVRIWLVGYSRSAAVANLLSSMLRTNNLCKSENIYTYTFATPSNQLIGSFSANSNNIFNIINPIDIVPTVPFKQWGFGKQGRTFNLPWTPDTAANSNLFLAVFSGLTAEYDYDYVASQPLNNTILSTILCTLAPTRLQYSSVFQPGIMTFCDSHEAVDAVELVFECGFGIPGLWDLLKSGKFITAIVLIKNNIERMKTAGIDGVGISALTTLLDLVKTIMYSVTHPISSTGRHEFGHRYWTSLFTGFEESLLGMQHWSETYMAWMLTADESEILNNETNEYKTRISFVRCPVDTEVYDEAGNLVARTTTETFVYTDDDGTEYPMTIALVDETVTTIEAYTCGDSKIFVFPDDQEYQIVIRTNENYEDGDTMTYAVIENGNGEETASITYASVELSEDSVFNAAVTTTEEKIETCTLTEGGKEIEPTEVFEEKPAEHTFEELNVDLTGMDYEVTGEIKAIRQDAVLLCGVYDANGKLLSLSSQAFQAANSVQEIQFNVAYDESGSYMKIFLLDALESMPLDECVIVYL